MMKVLPSKPLHMAVISFKTDDEFRSKLEALAQKKGINISAYIKLTLTQTMNGELVEITENGLTVAEELAILAADKKDKVSGPFTETKDLMKALDG